MAASAYYVKRDEDDETVTYRVGTSPAALSSLLSIDKSRLRPLRGTEKGVGLTERLALSQILRKYRDRGTWPERGSELV